MKTHASLLGLPPELRLPIYREVLAAVTVRLHNGLPIKSLNELYEDDVLYCNEWTLLHICRTIREEAFDLFYESTTFWFHDNFIEPKLCAWMDTIGPRAICNLRKILLHGWNRCRMYGLQAG